MIRTKLIATKITTKEAFCIARALKVKYGIKITDSIKDVNYNEFYDGLKKRNILCNPKILESLILTAENLTENMYELIEEGRKICLEEQYFKSLDWSQVISNLKTKFCCTNKSLSEITGCNYKSIGEWERNTKTPNYFNCKLLRSFILKNKLNVKELSSFEGKKHTYKSKYTDIKPLSLNPELAELIGILNGDGTITKSGLIAITGNQIEDIGHHELRVKQLIKILFDKDCYQKKVEGNVIKTEFTSLYISKQLKNIGLPIGKKDNIRIPQCILNDKSLLKPYLMGLFDTDGTVCRRNRWNIRVGYGSFKSKKFAEDIFYALKFLGFKSISFTSGDRFRIEIKSDIEVIRFFQEVGSCNYSKIARFVYWKLKHFCPTYPYIKFKDELKDKGIDMDKIKLPFIWKKHYINLLDNKLQEILMPTLKRDSLSLNMSYARGDIDWKNRISFLKKEFGLKILTDELNCNYKTVWQWQTGARIPNLEMSLRIKKICEKNGMRILTKYVNR